MKVLIIVAVLVAYVVADGFDDWKKKNGKSYSSKDAESAAASRYKAAASAVAKHNANSSNTYKTEANDAADKTAEENAQRNGYKYDPNVTVSSVKPKVKGDVPASLNLTKSMRPIREQGECGSCWAISAASVYEYAIFKNNSSREWMSEQNFVDCDAQSNGCNGGHPSKAMVYAKNNGISSGKEYKYVGIKQKCQRTKNKRLPVYKTATGACGADLSVRTDKEEVLKQLIAAYGPVVVAISVATCTPLGGAMGGSFLFYKSGIYNDQACSTFPRAADHAVVIVGYGVDAKNVPFWILRNSWGTGWGEQGYMRMYRGKNVAGVANMALLPCEAAVK